MGAALPIRDDVPAVELRRLAWLEADGRVACRLLASPEFAVTGHAAWGS
jgi:hypothetical protein